MERQRFDSHQEHPPAWISGYHLVYIQEGEGIMRVDGDPLLLKSGKVVLLKPDCCIEMEVRSGKPLFLYDFSFTYTMISDKPRQAEKVALSTGHHMLSAKAAVQLSLLLEQLEQRQGIEEPLAQWKQSILFQECMHLVLSDPVSSEETGGTREAIEKVLLYLQEHYRGDISLKEVAHMHGISASNFSGVFKKHVGLNPLDYVTQLRIAQAQRKLKASQPIELVAREVGFKDPLYFSRIFKRTVGVTPSIYRKHRHTDKIITLLPHLNDYLLALEVKPFATLPYGGNDHINGYLPYLARELQETKLTGSWNKPDMDELVEAQPGLILGSNWFPINLETVKKIAPTIPIILRDDWQSLLLDFARFFGKGDEWKLWMRRYEQKVMQAKSLLSLSHSSRESVMILTVTCSEYRVYGGRRQLGKVLYEDLQLTPPAGITTKAHYVCVNLEQIQAMNPDHIFLTTNNSNPSKEQIKNLKETKAWSSLRAVQKNQVYEVESWLNGHAPIKHSLSIDVAIDHLAANRQKPWEAIGM
ncbi:helix-turn-helix domain-containing protein [Brevibacillus nitrificans]|uniref:Helix-turn-helix domain-containing protein n=1 Tax=Brevibacillus nitrificans TaxID=651560 RepID=A0A3M8DPC7_9BACL|nr:helix-turn-helix domain-containing protein [Brevibacillus nitrificans]RNB89349.1 helix-turn-helix domain-containing protein [Brevibacillus nitrificans]